jgi:hypothetical protein
MRDPHERKRLQILWERARRKVTAIDEQVADKSVEMNRERIEYFEKIALGCGATIALVVSFVGAHAERLHPAWLLRSSLVVLALAMICAMYRNWRYPYYVLAALYKRLDKAMLEEAECKRNVTVSTDALSLQSGRPFDVAQVEQEFLRAKSALAAKISEFEGQERRVSIELRCIEPLTLILAILGLGLLIWLAWLNF